MSSDEEAGGGVRGIDGAFGPAGVSAPADTNEPRQYGAGGRRYLAGLGTRRVARGAQGPASVRWTGGRAVWVNFCDGLRSRG